MAFNEDSSGSGHDEPWIQWFCGLKGHEMFCEVERSYIEDGFNLYGLRACVSTFSDCLDLILDRIGPDDSDDSHLTQSACTLYGLIHARYIITAHGLDAMYNKYAAKEFGTCPLAQCQGQPVLPVGLKDEMGADTVKIFCPKCQCVYHPPPVRSRSGGSSSHHGAGGAAGVDGAAFGTTFPHLFLMTFSNLVPDPLPPDSAYIPRVFGFRVHMSARQRAPSNASTTTAIAAAPMETAGGSSKSMSRELSSSRSNHKSQEEVIKAYDNNNNNEQLEANTGELARKPAPEETVESRQILPTTTTETKPAAAATGEASMNGDSKEGASAAAKYNAKSSNKGGTIKRRASDEDNSSTAVKKEGNGFLVDNTTAKRRKRSDG